MEDEELFKLRNELLEGQPAPKPKVKVNKKDVVEIRLGDLSSIKHGFKEIAKEIKTDVREGISNIMASRATQEADQQPPQSAPAPQPSVPLPLPAAPAHVSSVPIPQAGVPKKTYSASLKLANISVLLGIFSLAGGIIVLILPYLSLIIEQLPVAAIQHYMSIALWVAVGICTVFSALTILTPMRLRAMLGLGFSLVAAVAYHFLTAASFIKHS